ncbi:sensor histidine kinase [Priestia megaterium]|uniref:sensor histidine kinase n=1 Tax=Priestia megaterium TaxID=1404 RepID=UPI0007626E16|nr:HAMP domain-containing sensor histidine kinase [Priestia megaterium]KWU63384.1 histidine kinase [Priestia megaterium]PEU69543.1 sensor histidine kinase [Priestia megaterium]
MKHERFFHLNSLRLQLLSRSLLVILSLLMLIGVFQYVFMKQFIYTNKIRSIEDQIHLIPDDVWKHDIETSQNVKQSSRPMVYFPGVNITFINQKSTFLRLAKDPHHSYFPKLSASAYKQVMKNSNQPDNTTSLIKKMDGHQEQVIVLKPIIFDGEIQGVIQINTPTESLRDLLIRQMLIFLMLSLTAMTIAFFVFSSVLKQTLVPLFTTTKKVEHINAGSLHDRLPVNQGQIEMDRLSLSINEMLERLEKAFKAETEAKEQMRRFVADASHELRTPLTSIHGFLEVLLRGASSNPEQLNDALKSMYGESKRLHKLIQDLLLLAQLDQLPPFQKEYCFVDELILDMKPQLILLAGNRKVLFDFPSRLPSDINKDQFKQVVLNLFSNAVQHTNPTTGVIQVIGKINEKELSLIIQDNGHGIPQEHLPHLFERFYKADASRSRAYGGAGLGLAISASIIELHGGKIRVESKLNAGTAFEIVLPLT